MQNLIENLTQYGDDELSLRVFNDEWLCDVSRAWGFETLKEELDHMFIYSPNQLKILEIDLDAEKDDETDDWENEGGK